MREQLSHLNWYDIFALYVKAETSGGSVSRVKNPRENFGRFPKALAASPHHFHCLVLEPLVTISIVNTSEEESIHAKLN